LQTVTTTGTRTMTVAASSRAALRAMLPMARPRRPSHTPPTPAATSNREMGRVETDPRTDAPPTSAAHSTPRRKAGGDCRASRSSSRAVRPAESLARLVRLSLCLLARHAREKHGHPQSPHPLRPLHSL
jgi:hypothetical protein